MKPKEVVQRWPKWGAAWAVGAIVKVKAATIATAAMVRFICPTVLRRLMSASGDTRRVTADGSARYFGAELDDRCLIPGDDARIAPTRFEDWLDKSAFAREGPMKSN